MSPVLSADEDAYGHAMIDALDGKDAYEVVERDDGFISLGAGPSLYLADYEDWREVERRAMDHVSGRVLDLGCGAGRFLLWLRDQGHEVVGIDNSPGAIDACRRRGLTDVHLVSLEELDERFGRFDTVLMLGGNFGLLGPLERGKDVLRRLREIAHAGAVLLGASRDPRASRDPDRLVYLRRNVEQGRLPGQYRIRIRYRRFATPWFEFLRVASEEMEEIIEGTGWRLAEVLREDESLYVGVLHSEG